MTEPSAQTRYHRRKMESGDEAYREKLYTRRQQYMEKLRHDVIQGYGGACTCCGESNESFLQIDHVVGGGNAHRRELGSTQAVYVWLRKNGYPDGFQVLCANCNMAKDRRGGCPHQRGR